MPLMGSRPANLRSNRSQPRRGNSIRCYAMFERFTEKAIKVVMMAQEEARRLGHSFVGTEQMLLGMMHETSSIAYKALAANGLTLKETRKKVEEIIGRGSGFTSVEIPFTPRSKRVLELAVEESRNLSVSYIGTEHLCLGLLKNEEGQAHQVMKAMGADPKKIRTEVMKLLSENEAVGAAPGGGTSSSHKTPTLEEFGSDLTKRAEQGMLDPCIGRDYEMNRAMQILGRRMKNNPCLIGEPGVGKSAIVEGLAQRIVSGDVPEQLLGRRIVTLDMGLLVAGTKYRGEFEERLKKLTDEVKQDQNIILFIDEIHTLIGAGAAEGAIDAANILKPALARGELQCIGATTIDEYRKHVEKDPALERRLQPIQVMEPSVDETIEICKGLQPRFEEHHNLRYTDSAIVQSAKLAEQYISDRFLPDKAIDLIDEAGSMVKLRNQKLPAEARDLDKQLKELTRDKEAAVRGQDFERAGQLRDQAEEVQQQIAVIKANKKEELKAEQEASGEVGLVVNEKDIANVVSSWTKIPVEKVSADEKKELREIEDKLHTRIVGQQEAIVAVARALRRARTGLKNPNRPVMSCIFAGPTGVGKSELAKALSRFYFGSEEAMIRLDMSEFMERHTVSKLIGSPPGYVGYNEGGQLTEAVRRRPYTVVLFDEIEKAHPDVFNMMLQILEDGRLTDSKGRVVDFKHVLLIMTSNVGSSVIEKGGKMGMGFNVMEPGMSEEEQSYTRIKNLVQEEMKQHFRPEFLNRLDEIIVFRQLTRQEVREIAEFMLKEVVDRAAQSGLTLEITERFKDRLCEEGFSASYGARPLRRAITRLLEDEVAEKFVSEELLPGVSAIVDCDAQGNVKVLTSDGKELQGSGKTATATGIQ